MTEKTSTGHQTAIRNYSEGDAASKMFLTVAAAAAVVVAAAATTAAAAYKDHTHRQIETISYNWDNPIGFSLILLTK